MLIRVEAHLVDLQPLGVILVIQVTKPHDALRAVLRSIDMEVEKHDLTLEARELLHGTLAVGQRDVDDARCRHLVGRDTLRLLCLHDALIAHAGNGDVVEVLTTLRLRIISVPACSHGRIDLHVSLTAVRVEDIHRTAADDHRLEEGKIRVSLHRCLEDIVGLDLGLIIIEHGLHLRAFLIVGDIGVVGNGIELRLKIHLHQRELLDLRALLRTLHIILIRHRGIGSLDLHVLRGVDGHIDQLPVDAQPVELGVVGSLRVKREGAIGTQLHGVDGDGTVQTHVLKVKERVLGIADGARHMKLLLSARGDTQRHQKEGGKFSEITYLHIIFLYFPFYVSLKDVSLKNVLTLPEQEMGIEQFLVDLLRQRVALVKEVVEHRQTVVGHHAFEVVAPEAVRTFRRLGPADAVVVRLVQLLKGLHVLAHDSVRDIIETVVPVSLRITAGIMIIAEHLQGGLVEGTGLSRISKLSHELPEVERLLRVLRKDVVVTFGEEHVQVIPATAKLLGGEGHDVVPDAVAFPVGHLVGEQYSLIKLREHDGIREELFGNLIHRATVDQVVPLKIVVMRIEVQSFGQQAPFQIMRCDLACFFLTAIADFQHAIKITVLPQDHAFHVQLDLFLNLLYQVRALIVIRISLDKVQFAGFLVQLIAVGGNGLTRNHPPFVPVKDD